MLQAIPQTCCGHPHPRLSTKSFLLIARQKSNELDNPAASWHFPGFRWVSYWVGASADAIQRRAGRRVLTSQWKRDSKSRNPSSLADSVEGCVGMVGMVRWWDGGTGRGSLNRPRAAEPCTYLPCCPLPYCHPATHTLLYKVLRTIRST